MGWNRANETIYFTFNGGKLATAFPLPADSILVPAAFIGLNDRVRFNFGQEPFSYQGLAEIQLDEETRERLEKEAEEQKKSSSCARGRAEARGRAYSCGETRQGVGAE